MTSPMSVGAKSEAFSQAAVARGLSVPHILKLAESAPPLWCERPVEQQIDDLALLLRPLDPDEIRVRVTTPSENSREWEVTVIATDRLGLLAITAATLSSFGLSIVRAQIGTWPDGAALQHLWVSAQSPSSVEPEWPSIGLALRNRLAHIASGSVEVGEFSPTWVRAVREIDMPTTSNQKRFVVDVHTSDNAGVLSAIASTFESFHMNVLSAEIETIDGHVRDTFVVEVPLAFASHIDRLQDVTA